MCTFTKFSEKQKQPVVHYGYVSLWNVSGVSYGNHENSGYFPHLYKTTLLGNIRLYSYVKTTSETVKKVFKTTIGLPKVFFIKGTTGV